ncbi:MAG: YmdB family metallophosphoesterase [Rickettsiales bacterium]|jgi:metallophosphoesterase (TIGR00282 family)|nr:YmdB family metallophosphoesterase [Rickettsiales bacterium]
MRILFFGDIVGHAARELLIESAAEIREREKIDFVIANADNAAHGFGLVPSIADRLFKVVDVLTAGDHAWDQPSIRPYIKDRPRLLRPANYGAVAEGRGHCAYDARGGRIAVVHLLGRLFMTRDRVSSPFEAADEILRGYKLGGNVDAIFVDFHAEATSEKISLAHYLDGRVSALIGTHTHVPTADARILPGGTAFLTDAGMCGVFDSSIGMEKSACVRRFLDAADTGRLVPADGEPTLCGAIVDTAARSIRQVFFGHKF